MQCPILFDEDGIVAYVKPVENFRNRLFNRSRRNKGLNVFTNLNKALTWPRLLSYAALKVLSNQGAYTSGVDNISKGLFMRKSRFLSLGLIVVREVFIQKSFASVRKIW